MLGWEMRSSVTNVFTGVACTAPGIDTALIGAYITAAWMQMRLSWHAISICFQRSRQDGARFAGMDIHRRYELVRLSANYTRL